MTTAPTVTAGGTSVLLEGDVWTFVLVHHPNADLVGMRFGVDEGRCTRLGRSSDLLGGALAVDERLSRAHATISAGETGLSVEDSSRNGTYVNGHRIRRAQLGAGDLLALGSCLLWVRRAPIAYAPVRVGELWGCSPEHAQLASSVEGAAKVGHNVNFHGEPGVGKRAWASALHGMSGRRRVHAIECRGLESSVLETIEQGLALTTREPSVDGLTLFLFGVEELSPQAQAALMPLLKARRISAFDDEKPGLAWVVTSRRPAAELAADNEISIDLATEMSLWSIGVPDIARRPEDIPLMFQSFAERGGVFPEGLTARAVSQLLSSRWAENVRGLGLFVERVAGLTNSARLNIDEPGLKLLELEVKRAPNELLPRVVRVDAAGTGFIDLNSSYVELRHRPTLQRILAALLRARRSQPGMPLSVDELFSEGWPDEVASAQSSANRVYVALNTLRKLGLRDVIEHRRVGYLIPEGAPVELNSD